MKNILRYVIFLFLVIFSTNYVFADMLEVLLDSRHIIVWRYWENNFLNFNEKFLIYNPNNSSINLKAYLSKFYNHGLGRMFTKIDSSKGIIIGPLNLNPYEYKIIEVPNLDEIDKSKYFFNFIKNDTLDLGLMYSKSKKPNNTYVEREFVTTQLKNSAQDILNAFWEQDFLTIKSGEIKDVFIIFKNETYQLTGENRRIIVIKKLKDKYNKMNYSKRNEELIDILDVNCSTLDFKLIQNHNSLEKAFEAKFPDKQSKSYNKAHTVQIQIKAPLTKKPVYKEIVVWDRCKGYGRGSTIPIFIIP